MRSVPSQLRSQLWCGALKGRGSHHGECFKDIRPATVWWRSGGWSCIAAYAIGRTSRLLWLNCNESHDERTSSRQPGAVAFGLSEFFLRRGGTAKSIKTTATDQGTTLLI